MEGREGREHLSRDDPRHQEALEKVGEIMAKFFDPKRTDGGFALRSIVSLHRRVVAAREHAFFGERARDRRGRGVDR